MTKNDLQTLQHAALVAEREGETEILKALITLMEKYEDDPSKLESKFWNDDLDEILKGIKRKKVDEFEIVLNYDMDDIDLDIRYVKNDESALWFGIPSYESKQEVKEDVELLKQALNVVKITDIVGALR